MIIIRKLHLYTALTFGVLFSLLGLTGSWLVFYAEIDSALFGFASRSSGVPQWERTLNTAEAATHAPGGMSMLRLPWGEHGTAEVLMQKGARMTDVDFSQAYLDTGSARILMAREVVSARQSLRTNLSGIAFVIHSGFLFGIPGAIAVGILALFLLLSVILGLCLWWPRGRLRIASLVVNSKPGSRAFLGELHSVVGLYASLLLGLAAVTGFHYAFQPLTRAAVAAVMPTAAASQPGMSTMNEHAGMAMGAAGPRLDADAAVARAKALFPRRSVKMLIRMGREHPMYQISLAPADGVSNGVGATQITLDGAGAVVAVQDPERERAGDTLLRWLVPLHTGAAFDMPGRVIMSIVGLTPTFFFVTGVWVWLRRKRAQRRAAAVRSSQWAAIQAGQTDT